MFYLIKIFVLAFIFLLAVVSSENQNFKHFSNEENDKSTTLDFSLEEDNIKEVIYEEIDYKEFNYEMINRQEVDQANIAVLSPPQKNKFPSGNLYYSYTCTVGAPTVQAKENKACHGLDTAIWISQSDHYVKLSCGEAGSGLRYSYIHISFQVNSPTANCYITEGGIDLNDTEVIIHIRNSSTFAYVASFYTTTKVKE